MNIVFTIILIGISLSMDAFSLSLIYGTYSLKKKDIFLLSSIVGVFHFFMPLMGLGFGGIISNFFLFNIDLVVGIIFGIIGIEMFVSSLKNDDISIRIGILGFLLFGLSVSIDSFTSGIGLSLITDNYFLAAVIFMIVSASFTFVGLNIGNRISDKLGKSATIIGGIIMIFLSFTYLF